MSKLTEQAKALSTVADHLSDLCAQVDSTRDDLIKAISAYEETLGDAASSAVTTGPAVALPTLGEAASSPVTTGPAVALPSAAAIVAGGDGYSGLDESEDSFVPTKEGG